MHQMQKQVEEGYFTTIREWAIEEFAPEFEKWITPVLTEWINTYFMPKFKAEFMNKLFKEIDMNNIPEFVEFAKTTNGESVRKPKRLEI